jgi:hypothetical protein
MMVRSWLGYLFLLLLLEKSLQAKIKKSLFKPKNLCGLCEQHQFVLVPGVKVGSNCCQDAQEFEPPEVLSLTVGVVPGDELEELVQ